MPNIDISNIGTLHENNQLEAKRAKGGLPASVWETYSAFANSDGGVILLGVREDEQGNLYPETGVDVDKLKKDFWNMVNNRQKISANIVTDRMVSKQTMDGVDILCIEIPRAERSARPVYVGLDPKTGTYRRNHDGDYHCSLEEISLMFRDASATSQDSKVLEYMSTDALCTDSIKRYRNFFASLHPQHLWNNEDTALFLRKIGATAIGSDGAYHPTCAGLLMFGYEYEITREFPNYFLDYQENRSIGETRWTDRLVSSSGDWSGNVFDFVIQVLNKLQQGLKVPFVLEGAFRIDDTSLHKALREAITNAVVHSDFYGRQGIVIQKSEQCYVFTNPGNIRISISEAVEGGVSDPRNALLLKMFSLIDFGERAGSGLSGICQIWKSAYTTMPQIVSTTKNGVERTTLTLQYTTQTTTQTDQTGDQTDQSTTQSTTQTDQTDQTGGQFSALSDIQKRIVQYLHKQPKLTRKSLAAELNSITEDGLKYHLKKLKEAGVISRIGTDNGGMWKVNILIEE